MSELVEDLELWLDAPAYVDTRERGREIDRASWLIGRARDEIVRLRKLTDGDWVWQQITSTRDAALEEAAQEIDCGISEHCKRNFLRGDKCSLTICPHEMAEGIRALKEARHADPKL